jgi:hypothetical protein
LAFVKIYVYILILVLARYESRSLVSSSNLKHRMRMSFLGFALFAEVKVWADTALVSDTLDWVNLASITSYALVNLC